MLLFSSTAAAAHAPVGPAAILPLLRRMSVFLPESPQAVVG